MCKDGENPRYFVFLMSAGHKYQVRNFLLTETINSVPLSASSIVSVKGIPNSVLLNSSSIKTTSFCQALYINVFKISLFGGLGLKWNKMSRFASGGFGQVA